MTNTKTSLQEAINSYSLALDNSLAKLKNRLNHNYKAIMHTLHLISWWHIAILFLVGGFAGAIDSMAGGGGLITIPFLLHLGLPPTVALGTNRLQSSLGELTAICRFARHFKYKFKPLCKTMLLTIIGAGLGSYAAVSLHWLHLRTIIPWLLLAVLIFYIFYRPPAEQRRKAAMPIWMFSIISGVSIGFYNGFLGPCTGSLWAAAYIIFLGYGLGKATAYAKPQNLIGNIASFIIFGSFSHLAYAVALVMGLGQILGANIGAAIVIRQEQKWLKPIIIIIVALMIVMLFTK